MTEPAANSIMSVCAAIAALGLFALIGYGCKTVEKRLTSVQLECIKAGGTWHYSACIQPGPKP